MTTLETTRVVVISDQAIYLRGLVEIIQTIKNFSVVGQGQNAKEGIQLCQICSPDIAVFSLSNLADSLSFVKDCLFQSTPKTLMVCMTDKKEQFQIELNAVNDRIYFFDKHLSEEEFSENLTRVCQDHNKIKSEPKNQLIRYEHHEVESEDLSDLDLYLASSEAIKNNALVVQELEMAGKIQKDILPEQVPTLPGWEICAVLEPARETSGDFYDFIPLTEHKWGVVIADVIDKGMGAALFMALTSTLIRTYASRFPTLPALTLNAVSARILNDTRGGMFVTAIYCVLEPLTGRIIFSNGGHPPGYLVHTNRQRDALEVLRPTGMALGVSEDAQWKQKIYRLNPGDVLVFYTDGVTEAENAQGEFFGEERVVDVILSMNGSTAKAIQQKLLDEVHRFSGKTAHLDDIAIITIRRL